MDWLYLSIFAAAALVFASVVAGLYSSRAGFSTLLVFLLAGMPVRTACPGDHRRSGR